MFSKQSFHHVIGGHNIWKEGANNFAQKTRLKRNIFRKKRFRLNELVFLGHYNFNYSISRATAGGRFLTILINANDFLQVNLNFVLLCLVVLFGFSNNVKFWTIIFRFENTGRCFVSHLRLVSQDVFTLDKLLKQNGLCAQRNVQFSILLIKIEEIHYTCMAPISFYSVDKVFEFFYVWFE